MKKKTKKKERVIKLEKPTTKERVKVTEKSIDKERVIEVEKPTIQKRVSGKKKPINQERVTHIEKPMIKERVNDSKTTTNKERVTPLEKPMEEERVTMIEKPIGRERVMAKDKSNLSERVIVREKPMFVERLENIPKPLVKLFYDIQKLRIQTQLRVGNPKANLTDSEKLVLESYLERLKKTEEEIVKDLKGFVINHPVYQNWLSRVKGIGIVLSAGLLYGGIDIRKAERPSDLWRFCGLGVVNGKAERMTKGEKLHYSNFMKTMMWKVSDSFNKNRNRSEYGRLLAELHENEKDHECEACKKSKSQKMHGFRRARRKLMKIFVFHLWYVWRCAEGLEVCEPYINRDEKKHIIIAPMMDRSVAKE